MLKQDVHHNTLIDWKKVNWTIWECSAHAVWDVTSRRTWRHLTCHIHSSLVWSIFWKLCSKLGSRLSRLQSERELSGLVNRVLLFSKSWFPTPGRQHKSGGSTPDTPPGFPALCKGVVLYVFITVVTWGVTWHETSNWHNFWTDWDRDLISTGKCRSQGRDSE